MKTWMSLMMILALLSFVTMGCGGDKKDGADKPATDQPAGYTSQADETPTPTPPVTPTSLVAEKYAGKMLCGDCVHTYAKNTEHKCDTDHVHAPCEECGFPKGTALCCGKLTPDEAKGKQFCGSCGQIAGSDNCCSPDGTKCEKCGFHEGSALCCKLKAEG